MLFNLAYREFLDNGMKVITHIGGNLVLYTALVDADLESVTD